MSALLAIPAPIGQLGNRLVHFAHVRAYAAARKTPLIHLAFHPYADSFATTAHSLFCVFDPVGGFYDSLQAHKLRELFLLFLENASNSFPSIDCKGIHSKIQRMSFVDLDRLVTTEMRELVFAFGFVLRSWIESQTFKNINAEYFKFGDEAVDLEIHPQLNQFVDSTVDPIVILDGWGLRSPRNFEMHLDRVRQDLSPLPPILERAINLESKARLTKTLIGLHVRRGDYADWRNGEYFFSWERYSDIANQIVSRLGRENTSILVCSSETPPADFLNGYSRTLSQESALVDMYALSKCDLIVGPPSTFSGWASVISGVQLINISSGGEVDLSLLRDF